MDLVGLHSIEKQLQHGGLPNVVLLWRNLDLRRAGDGDPVRGTHGDVRRAGCDAHETPLSVHSSQSSKLQLYHVTAFLGRPLVLLGLKVI